MRLNLKMQYRVYIKICIKNQLSCQSFCRFVTHFLDMIYCSSFLTIILEINLIRKCSCISKTLNYLEFYWVSILYRSQMQVARSLREPFYQNFICLINYSFIELPSNKCLNLFTIKYFIKNVNMSSRHIHIHIILFY